MTLLAGFVVLAFAPMALLVDFGVVVAVDVVLALVSLLVMFPPLLRRHAARRHVALTVDTVVVDLTEVEVEVRG